MWLRRVLLGVLVILSITFQVTIVPQLGGYLNRLDLPLVLVAAISLIYGGREGAWFGLTIGLLRDVLTGLSLGFYALPLYVLGYSLGSFSRIVFRDAFLVPLLVGLVATAGYWVLQWLIGGFIYGFWLSGGYWLLLPGAVVVNGLVVPLLYAWLQGPLRPEEAISA